MRSMLRLSAALLTLSFGLAAFACQSPVRQDAGSWPGERLLSPKSKYELKNTRRISPDGRHVAFLAMSWGLGGTWSWAVIDCVDQKKYHAAEAPSGYGSLSGLSFSPNSRSVAYIVSLEGKQFVVLNGKEGKRYDSVNALVFSPDGRLAYFARIGVKYFIVIDGREGKTYDPTGDVRWAWIPVFSPDGRQVAFVASADHKVFMVVGGKEQRPYDTIGWPVFSPDGRHLGYAASENGGSLLVVDGKPGMLYSGEHAISTILYSPDSKRLAYVATDEAGSFVTVDSTPGKHYGSVSDFTFSPDGRHLAYSGQTTGGSVVVLDGVEGRPYGSVSGVVFSPDSQRLSYVGLRDDKFFVVIDGVEAYQYASASSPVFSPDSRRFAFPAQPPGAWGVTFVVDGVEGKKYGPVPTGTGTGLSHSPPVFSPDSRHVVYRVNQFLVVDGVETQVFGQPIGNIVFESATRYWYLSDKDGDVYLVQRVVP